MPRTKKTLDGRALRFIDPELITLFKQVLQLYGTSGTKLIFQNIIAGRIKPRF